MVLTQLEVREPIHKLYSQMIGLYVKNPVFIDKDDKCKVKYHHKNEIKEYIGELACVFFYHIVNTSSEAMYTKRINITSEYIRPYPPFKDLTNVTFQVPPHSTKTFIFTTTFEGEGSFSYKTSHDNFIKDIMSKEELIQKILANPA